MDNLDIKNVLNFNCSPEKDELIEIMKKYHSDDPDAREQAALDMYGILYCYAMKVLKDSYGEYLGKYREDLLSCVFLGIADGMSGYDPEKGAPSTWFHSRMIHECEVFLNSEVRKTTAHYAAATQKLKNAGMDIDHADADTVIPKSTLEQLQKQDSTVFVSISTEECDYDIPSYSNSPEDEYINMENECELKSLLSVLSDREQIVCVYSHGLFGNVRLHHKQISKIIGVSPNTVSRIKRRAEKKLAKVLSERS